MIKSISTKTALSLLASLALAGCNRGTQTTSSVSSQMLEEARSITQPWASDAAPGVAVAVSLNDEIVFASGEGLANLEHDAKITPDSVFQVASVSKQFTAFATLMLVSEGKIDLEADIRTYLPELNQTEETITVRHLLDHMAGLRERNLLAAMAGWMQDDIQTEAQLTELVMRQRGVNFRAGDEVEYSNTGYALLAEIVSRVSGQSFQAFMEERVFQPLNMTDTRVPDSRSDLIPGRAASYYPDGDGFKNIVSAGEAIGSTGLYTTALDLLKWAENFETQAVGNEQVFQLMAERSKAANRKPSVFARGQELRPYNGLQTWSHGGRDAGYRSFVLRVPEEDFELSILSNRTDFDTAKMAFALVDTFLSGSENYQASPPEPFVPATPEQLASYSGDYEVYSGVILSFRATPEGLTFAEYGEPRSDLEALPQIGEREFELNPQAGNTVKFSQPESGVSTDLVYKIGLHGTLEAKRVELDPFDPELIKLEDHAGVYHSAELGAQYTLTIKDGALFAKHVRLPEFALTPYQIDVFSGLAGPLQKVEFIRDADGEIVGFYASAPLVERIRFDRLNEG